MALSPNPIQKHAFLLPLEQLPFKTLFQGAHVAADPRDGKLYLFQMQANRSDVGTDGDVENMYISRYSLELSTGTLKYLDQMVILKAGHVQTLRVSISLMGAIWMWMGIELFDLNVSKGFFSHRILYRKGNRLSVDLLSTDIQRFHTGSGSTQVIPSENPDTVWIRKSGVDPEIYEEYPESVVRGWNDCVSGPIQPLRRIVIPAGATTYQGSCAMLDGTILRINGGFISSTNHPPSLLTSFNQEPPTITTTMTTVPVSIPIIYGNMYGGYDLTEKDWNTRIEAQVSLILSAGVDLAFMVELHGEPGIDLPNGGAQYFLERMRVRDPDWALCLGQGGNQCLYRPSIWEATNHKNVLHAYGNRWFTDFSIRHLSTNLTKRAVLDHFIANGKDVNGNTIDNGSLRVEQMKELVAYCNENPIDWFLGDFNSATFSIGFPRDIAKKAGWVGLRDRGTVANVGATNWIEDIWTRPGKPPLSNSRVISTNGASDHTGWFATEMAYTGTIIQVVSVPGRTTSQVVDISKLAPPGLKIVEEEVEAVFTLNDQIYVGKRFNSVAARVASFSTIT